MRVERLVRLQRAAYKAGYQAGERAEYRRQQQAPAPWDAWNQRLDVTDVKRMSHKMEGRA